MRVLVTYSSAFGTTKEVAEYIAVTLNADSSFQVALRPVDEVESVDSFDSVIVGSSVRADRMLANVRDFLSRHRNSLVFKKFSLFVVCLTASTKGGQDKAKSKYIDQELEKYPELQPLNTAAFGGRISSANLNPVMQILMKRVLNEIGLPQREEINAQDWNAIRRWTQILRDQLKAAA